MPAHEPVPVLPSLPLLGNVHLLDSKAPVQSLMRLTATHGSIFRFSMPGGTSLVVVSEPALVAELCDTARFGKSVHPLLRELRGLAGDGLFTAETREPSWGVAHRVLMPAFGPVAVRGMFDHMADIADQMVLRWERFGSSAVVDVGEDMTRLTLDTIALCAFGFRFNSFYRDQLHPFVDAMVKVLVEADARTTRPGVVNRLMVGQSRRYHERIAAMHALADELVATRRAGPVDGAPDDLLSRMLYRRDPETGLGLSDDNIRYQMITFLIAGHETTSGLLSFALWFLLQHPEVWNRARELVDDVVGDAPLTVHHLPRLGYLEQVLKESLRIWPTAPAFAVEPLEATLLGGRFAVGPGDSLLVLTPELHRRPELWDEPLAFRPERFAPEARDAIPAHAYKPFGHGARACIGRAFALQEAVIVLAKLLQKVDVVLADPDYVFAVKETLTLKPDQLRVRVRARPPVGPRTAPVDSAHAVGAPDTLTSLLVLYGSDTGTSETFARQLAAEATARGAEVGLACLDDHCDDLPTDRPVVLLTSSYLGQPPRNARRFMAWLDEVEPGQLSGRRHAVFGCGDRAWAETYQAVPRRLDTALSAAGSTPLTARGEGDAGSDLLTAFDAWRTALWQALSPRSAEAPHAVGLHVQVVDPSEPLVAGPADLRVATVVDSRPLVDVSAPGAVARHHIELALPHVTYRAGDYLLVQPENPPEVVERFLARFALSAETHLVLHRSGGATFLPVGRPLPAGDLLARYVELSRPASRAQVELFIEHTRCPPERAALMGLLDQYDVAVAQARVSALELLERFEACTVPLAAVLDTLSPLRPRQYSISSSPRWRTDRCTLTVTVVGGPARSGRGRFVGVASTYLSRTRPGDRLRVAVVAAPEAFHLPTDPSVPLILVGAGSGIAPLRAFLQERQALADAGARVGEAALFYGCNHPETDLIYGDELAAWQSNGTVEVFPAFSLAPQGGVTFVQHRLATEHERVRMLLERGARIYVCGSRPMADGVRAALAELLAPGRGAEGADRLAELRASGRYAEDVFS